MRWIRGTVVRVARPDEHGLIHADGRMLPYALDKSHGTGDPLRQDMAVEFTMLPDGSAVGVHSLVAGSLIGHAVAVATPGRVIAARSEPDDFSEAAALGAGSRAGR